MRRRASYRSVSGLRINARLDSAHGLPSSMAMDRGAGSWSRQSAVALDGTTFIELGTAEDTARFDYGGGLEGVLVEPAVTNLVVNPLLVDVAPNNNVPDGWTTGFGAAGVNFQAVAGGPLGAGGTIHRIIDSAGHFQLVVIPGGSAISCSMWVRRVTAAGAFTVLSVDVPPGGPTMALGAAVHDWQRYAARETTVGAGAALYMIYRSAGSDDVLFALPMVAAEDVASSFVDGARAAELLTVDPSLVGRTSGDVQLQCRFDYASTAALTVRPCIFPWAAGYEVVFDPADDKIKVVVAGVDRAETAALTFARQTWHDVRVLYGASGQRLIVDGVETTNATAWGDPGVLATYLGSRAASVNCRPGAIARFTSAWL